LRGYAARAGTSSDDRPDVFSTQRSGEPAPHEPVHELHAFKVAHGCHDLDERAVERQRALELTT
jgi:hypothetical protein